MIWRLLSRPAAWILVSLLMWAGIGEGCAQVYRGLAPGFRPGFQFIGGASQALYSDLTQGVLPAWLTASGGANGTVTNAAGNIVAASAPRFDYTGGTANGLLIEEQRTNLFLNSQSPATQTIAVTNGTTYTVSLQGAGSIALSGAGTGTVTASAPISFSASSTSLTVTVSGAITIAQVEAGAFKTSPIITTTAAVTRSADLVSFAGAGLAFLQGAAMTQIAEFGSLFNPGNGGSIIGSPLNANLGQLGSATQLIYYNGSNAIVVSVSGLGTGYLRSGYAYNATNRYAVAAGGTIVSDSNPGLNANIQASNTFYLGNSSGGTRLDGYIRKLALYSYQLPPSTLQAKTVAGAALP